MRASFSAVVLSLLLLALLLPPAHASADCPNGQGAPASQLIYVAPFPIVPFRVIPEAIWKPNETPRVVRARTWEKVTPRHDVHRAQLRYRAQR